MPKLEQFPLDIRTREINLKRAKITKEELDKHLKSLPDDGRHAAELSVYEEEVTTSPVETESLASEGSSSEEL